MFRNHPEGAKMITILKLTYANIKQKKFRSLLIILSVTLTVGLMYTILSLSNSTTEMIEHKVRKEVGNAELMIVPKEESDTQFIKKLDFNGTSGMEYQIPLISAYGYTKMDEDMIPVAFTGMSEQDYDRIYGLKFTNVLSDSLTGNHGYIGKETAEKYGLKLGDELEVSIAGVNHVFSITGILEDQNNNLGYDLGRLELLVSADTLKEALGLSNEVNAYYIKSLKDYGKNELLQSLEEAYPEYEISDITDLSDFKQIINMVVTSLLLMVLAVVMVSTFIIYSSFKIISIERMPLMGTLRSIGATRKTTVRTLLFEALFYGLNGGIFGNALGVLILTVTMKMMFTNFGMTIEDISYFNIKYILIALLIGFLLSVGSAILPIVKMSKKSIKSIMFSEIRNEKHISLYKTIIGAVMVAAAFVIFNTAPVKLQLILNGFGVLIVTVGCALMIPMLSIFMTKLLSVLLKPFGRDGLGIVTANIKNDRTMMNNIMLLAMGLGVILMINNFSTTVGSVVTDVYGTGKADAVIFSSMESSFAGKVRQVDGVEHVYTTKETMNISANDGNINLLMVEGIDGQGYCEYAWNEFSEYLNDDLLDTFKSERSILISKYNARKYDISLGDTLKLDFNGKSVNYKVIGIVPTMMNNGSMSFVYEDFLEEDAGVGNYQSMFINIDDQADTKQVIQTIKELMPNQILPIQTIKEMQDRNVKQNNSLFFMMKAVSIIAMFIGVIGIFNNFTISFLSRRKLVATMRSLGLSKSKTVQNMLFEAFYCGLLGTISGLALGSILLKAMCYMVDAMGIPGDVMFYSGKDYLFVLISGMVLSMVSAILPAFSITKENIVSGLRYE
jgi:putative ABC transport system permease protein